jgi:Methyltransferase domain
MMKQMPPKVRDYNVDTRHIVPMLWDFVAVAALGITRRKNHKYIIQSGRDIRQRAFDMRDPMPAVEIAALNQHLDCKNPRPFVLPSVEVILEAGLGYVGPYVMLATIVSALQPKRILEIGTFRGAGALTMALNAPGAEIYTVDLPDEEDGEAVAGLTRGDKTWVRLSQGCKGAAFVGEPAESRIHQIRADSMKMNAAEFIRDADFCFVDGGHSYECIKADTENALKVLSPDGVIVWDDYTWFVEGVSRYLRELSKTLPLKRIAGSQFVIYRRQG